MDRFFHSTFNFFSYALPGSIIVITLIFLDKQFYSIFKMIDFVANIGINVGIFIGLLGYIIGFAINPLGRKLYLTLGYKIYSSNQKIIKNKSDKYVLIRETSPENFKYIETWNMFCAMSHNLAIASIIVVILSIVKMILIHKIDYFWL